MKKISLVAIALLALVSCSTTAPEGAICIDARSAVNDISPNMYGIFFEDINYGADGGLYAELVKNRSFEFPNHLMGWTTAGKVSVVETSPFDRNPHALRMEGASCVQNEGFFGMGFRRDEKYRFSVWARLTDGDEATLRLQLGNGSSIVSTACETITSSDWLKYTVFLTADATIADGTLSVMHEGATVELDHISLFPVNTFNGHENGLRADLAQALCELQPRVFRFPGGCIIEGNTLATRYQWKNSVGPVENRPLNENRWLNAMPDRLSPDYYQSYGLGFYEYFQLAEEIGATPLPVLSCGMACEFANDPTTEGDWLVPLDELQPYIDDALDLIEFANGDPATNEWARLRAEMGHPAPFNLRYIAIGNEQWGRWFAPRLKMFTEQIRAKYPDIQLIGSAGPFPEGEEFDILWDEMKELQADLVDEHYYNTREWFLSHATRYDSYDRQGPAVFAGEYACHAQGTSVSHNQYDASLAEAAFMTGLERNADIVRMATYAPLFAHVQGWQWRPDMIWFNSLDVIRSVSYYVQQMYATNAGTHVLPTTLNDQPVAGLEGQNGLYASAVIDKPTKEIIIKIINTSQSAQPVRLHFRGHKGERDITFTTLSCPGEDEEVDNIDQPDRIAPVTTTVRLNLANDEVTIPARSFVVMRFRK